MKKPVFVVVASLASLAVSVPAQAEKRAKVFVNGTYGMETAEYSHATTSTQFLEEASFSSDHSADPVLGGEMGLQYNVTQRLGLRASYAFANRDLTASYAAQLPHPFFFDTHREVAGDVTELSYKESAGRLDVVLIAVSEPVEISVFAGLAMLQVEADLIEGIDFSEAYPYDTVTVESTNTSALTDTAIGFDAGVSLDFMLTESFGVGAEFRYSGATAELIPAEGEPIELDLGGPEAAIGIRFAF